MQYDTKLPILAVKMFVNGQNYYLPSNADVNIRFGKRDNTGSYNPALGCDSSRHIVYLEITAPMTLIYGDASFVVEVVINGETAASGAVGVVVDRNPVQLNSVETSSEYKTAQKYADEAVQAASQAAASATQAATSASNASTYANNASTSATQAATSASNASTYANNASASESQAAKSATTASTQASNAATSATQAAGSAASASRAEDAAHGYADSVSTAREELIALYDELSVIVTDQGIDIEQLYLITARHSQRIQNLELYEEDTSGVKEILSLIGNYSENDVIFDSNGDRVQDSSGENVVGITRGFEAFMMTVDELVDISAIHDHDINELFTTTQNQSINIIDLFEQTAKLISITDEHGIDLKRLFQLVEQLDIFHSYKDGLDFIFSTLGGYKETDSLLDSSGAEVLDSSGQVVEASLYGLEGMIFSIEKLKNLSAAHGVSIETIFGLIETIAGRVDTHDTSISDLVSKVSDLIMTTNAHGVSIETLSGLIETITSRVDVHDLSIDSLLLNVKRLFQLVEQLDIFHSYKDGLDFIFSTLGGYKETDSLLDSSGAEVLDSSGQVVEASLYGLEGMIFSINKLIARADEYGINISNLFVRVKRLFQLVEQLDIFHSYKDGLDLIFSVLKNYSETDVLLDSSGAEILDSQGYAIGMPVYGLEAMVFAISSLMKKAKMFANMLQIHTEQIAELSSMFHSYPNAEEMLDSSGENVIDSSGNNVSGRIMYAVR